MQWLRVGARVFVVTGVLFGALQFLLHGRPLEAVGSGVFFGLAMVLVLVLMSRAMGGDGRVTASRDVGLVIPPGEVHQLVLGVLTRLPARVTRDGPDRIEVRTGMTWSSWGEVVVADLAIDGFATRLSLSSRPWLGMTLVDYGRNRRNVERLVADLDALGVLGARQ